jgi:DNA-binding GntR family transcriptional regulator
MQRLTQAILEHVAGLPEGVSVSAKALLHLGSRAAVDQALSRLVRRGQLIRAGRGLYVRPIESRFGMRPPSVENVVRALAASTEETIASHGAAAANALGLTTQVPIREVYLTSGPSRQLKLGSRSVELRHAPKWQLTLANRPAGEAIRALAWLGEAHAPAALQTLSHRLPTEALAEIIGARPRLPTWLAQQVSRLAVNG